MACVDGSLDIGCFDNCNAVESGLIATQTGTHYVIYKFAGQKNRVAFEGVIGAELVVPNIFNDFGHSVFKIEQPDGSYFVKTVDNYDYNSFQIDITPSNNIAPTVFAGTTDNAFTDAEKAKLEGLEGVTLFSDAEADTGTYYGADKVYVRRYSINNSEFNSNYVFLDDFFKSEVKKILRIDASIEYTTNTIVTITKTVLITGIYLHKHSLYANYRLYKDLATPIQNTDEQFEVDIYYTKN